MKRIFAIIIILCLILSGSAYSESWRVPVTVSNGSGTTGALFFGVHPEGSAGLDPELGEVNLPPPPPLSVFETRFLVSGYEGFIIDIRDTTGTPRFHNLKWQAGSGGYPVTVSWIPDSLGTGIFTISDPFGGVFIPPIDMSQESSLTIPVDQSFLTQLKIEVIPGMQSSQAPEIHDIPEQKIFSGQRFPCLNLDQFVLDPDTPLELLTWSVSPNLPLSAFIGDGNTLYVSYPIGWNGSEVVKIFVEDEENNIDSTAVYYTAQEGGILSWSVPVYVNDFGNETQELIFGVDPEGTEGLDPLLGEINLPPVPPSGIFDARFEISTAFQSIIDIRDNGSNSRTHVIDWQPGSGGYPISVTWDNFELPRGEFFVSDILGGIFIPETNMHEVSEIVVEDIEVVSLQIIVTPEVDNQAPVGPDNLEIDSITDSTVALSWETAIEPNFAYYEIHLDTADFTESGNWVWDWCDDSSLTILQTVSTIVSIPVLDFDYYLKIRAWDIFGNVGEFSNGVFTGSVPAINDLVITVSGNDIILEWIAPPWTNGTYHVYRDNTAYFFLENADDEFTFQGPATGIVTWEDIGAMAQTEQFFYRVTIEY